MKEFEGGRRPTKERSGIKWNFETEHERQRWRHEQTRQERVWSNINNWGMNPVSFLRKNVSSVEFWLKEIAVLIGNGSILDQLSTRTAHGWTEIEEKQIEPIVNRRQMTETNQQQDSDTTLRRDFVTPALYHIRLWAAGLVTPFVATAWRENAC